MFNIGNVENKQINGIIGELRKLKLIEEKKLAEDKRIEVLKEKKRKDNEKKNKTDKKSEQFFTYDQHGRYIDVKSIDPCPLLVKGSSRINTINNEESDLKNEVEEIKKTGGKPNKGNLLRRISLIDQLKSKLKSQNPLPIKFHDGSYNLILPALGVTFSESGKMPKKILESADHSSGKISKTEFHAMISDQSLLEASYHKKKTKVNESNRDSKDWNMNFEKSSFDSSRVNRTEMSLPERTWKGIDSSISENVDISRNISEIFVEDYNLYGMHNPNALSILPFSKLSRQLTNLTKRSKDYHSYGIMETDLMNQRSNNAKPIEIPMREISKKYYKGLRNSKYMNR